MCSVSKAQIIVDTPQVTVQVPTYTVIPPSFYFYQTPPVQIRIIPRPSYYIKIRQTKRSLFNFFQPWIPVYVSPPPVVNQ